MKIYFSKTLLLLLSTVLLLSSLTTNAALLLDGGFEKDGIPDWVKFGAVYDETDHSALINDSRALKIFGNFASGKEYSVASQLIAVDGTNFSVGDQIQLTGLIGHLEGDALEGNNRAYIEVSFTNISTDINLSNLAQSEFLTATSAKDLFINVETPIIKIPDLVSGLNTAFIRVAAVFFQDEKNVGAAWFDDLSLNRVPAPSTFVFLSLSIMGLLLARRK